MEHEYIEIIGEINDYPKEEYDKLVYCKPVKINSAIVEGMNTTYAGLVERFTSQNIKTEFEKSEASKKKIEPFVTEKQCHDCGGKRYNESVLSSKIMGYSIADFTALQLDALLSLKKVKPGLVISRNIICIICLFFLNHQ